MSGSRKWTDLPANDQVDAALRRAAAGVCGLDYRQRHRGQDAPNHHIMGVEIEGRDVLWLPDQSRDDLARVFVAALLGEKLSGRYCDVGDPVAERFTGAWAAALHDLRAALCQLLDLLAIPVPEGLTQ